MLTEVNGLVIKTVDLTGKDRLLIIYSAEKGIISAVARGCKDYKYHYMAASQPFCFCRFILYRKGDKYWLREAEVLESFYALRADITLTALASYICDVIYDSATSESDGEYLRLALNTLYAICEKKYDTSLIKAAFELRAACLLGFRPGLDGCAKCGRSDGDFILDIMDGRILCSSCRMSLPDMPEHSEGYRRIIELVTPSVLCAMRYVCGCLPAKLFSFRISNEDDRRLFCRAAESYLINHLERSFKSLEFYHEVK